MAQESCNLDKDDAEILKPSSSSPSPVASAASSTFPQPIPNKTCEEPKIEKPLLPEATSPAGDDAEAFVQLREEAAIPKVEDPAVSAEEPPVGFVNRCSVCRKRTGLTGFRCRCGDLFCPRHRYAETHDCSFDYKTSGREEIARANPLVRASKMMKI